MAVDREPEPIAIAAGRGLIGAMAMTGMRTVTTGLGLLERTPPEAAVTSGLPRLAARLSPDQREVVIELAHWSYGAAGGAAFGLLPSGLRRHRWAGPAYGVAMWLGFELGIAPHLGVSHAPQRTVVSRLMVALDHVLYGVIVAR